MSNLSASTPLLPAAGDVVVAWPAEPQQLFLLLHGAGQQPADWQYLAQALARQFPQGVVAVLATSAALLQGGAGQAADGAASIQALRTLLQAWHQHTGLGPERTALFAPGATASVALQAAAQAEVLAARLFAVGGNLRGPTPAIAAHTTLHWLHGQDDATLPEQQAQTTAQRLQALDVDFTLDVLPGTCTVCSPGLQQRVLHLLQNHIPQRIWREALAAAGQAAPAGNKPLH